MNPPEMLFACNEAASSYADDKADLVKLRTAGPGKNVRVELNDLGRQFNADIEPALVDLVEIAALVYVADQMKRRGVGEVETMGATWRRRMRFEISVRVPGLWNSEPAGGALLELLSFLSEDEYEFSFSQYRHPPSLDSYLNFGKLLEPKPPESVVLFSGGLDSLGGVLEEVVRDQKSVLLVTHAGVGTKRARHTTLQRMIVNATPGPRPQFVTVRADKKHRSEREYTQRARSFLYAAFAVVVARMADLEAVRFYENGVVSLNLPLSPQVVGARATRTTHPRVLACMRRLFSLITDTSFKVDNGFLWKTKGDVVADIVKLGHGSMIDWSSSCTHTRKFRNDKPHCGECSQCIDRRFAVLSSGASPFEPACRYRHQLLTDPRSAGESRIMLASYLETAQQVADMDFTSFYSRYGEAARALPHIELPADEAARRIHELYVRHGKQVMSAIEAAGIAHITEIRKRALPQSCTLRLVHDPSVADDGATSEAPTHRQVSADQAKPSENVFRRKGRAWVYRYRGRAELVLLPCRGAAYLHRLLSSPGKQMSVAELVIGVAKAPQAYFMSDADRAFDKEAHEAYRASYEDMKDDLERATVAGDDQEIDRIKANMLHLAKELKKVGLGGRVKREKSVRNRLRNSVGNAIARAIDDIACDDDEFAQHLRDHVKRGYDPVYVAPNGIVWETDVLHGM